MLLSGERHMDSNKHPYMPGGRTPVEPVGFASDSERDRIFESALEEARISRSAIPRPPVEQPAEVRWHKTGLLSVCDGTVWVPWRGGGGVVLSGARDAT